MIIFLVIASIGVVLMILGINNLKGNLDSIHWYHRQRVTEENKGAFGKLMGIGLVFCSIGILMFSVMLMLSELTENPIFMTIGSYWTVVGLAIGVGMMIYATVKYNKGIF